MKQAIAKNLIHLRGKLRQKEIAAAIGVKLARYQKWEEGKAEPSASMLLLIAEYHRVSVEKILKEPAI